MPARVATPAAVIKEGNSIGHDEQALFVSKMHLGLVSHGRSGGLDAERQTKDGYVFIERQVMLRCRVRCTR